MGSWIDKLRLWRLRRRRYFRLNPEKLHPGDIIFSTERAPVSYMIRHLTSSDYSHAGIYLGHGLYAEAVGEGVRARAATTIVKEKLKVIRLKSTSNSEEVARAAADRVDEYLHSPYALPGAILSLLSGVPSKDSRALFCSQLIAQAYADVASAVVPEYPPEKVTPALLANSKLFDDVTETTSFRAWAVPEHLVRPFETLSDREAKIVENMYRALCPFFEKWSIVTPGTWTEMLLLLADINHDRFQKELDSEVLTVMKNEGYVGVLSAVVKEVIEPFKDWLAEFDTSQLSEEIKEAERFSFTNNLRALERQAEIDLDNQRFWMNLQRKTHLGTFLVLVKYTEKQYSLRTEMITLTKAALEKLDH
jgi:Permuted papain-like amidase enzyme, YaeF/YiiX, C92 family